MTFDWREYLTLAENLYTNSHYFPNQEACFRVAISRAYYAAFCTARNYAKKYDRLILRKTGEDHRIVKDHYRTHLVSFSIIEKIKQRENGNVLK